ncbi:MAG: SDR family NAD(P)-dependent oxidoreductase [Bacteroidota bacterium]
MLQKGPYNRLENQIALVTGANSGIGKAVAIELAREGATVIVNWVFNEEAAEEVVQQIQLEGGKGMHIKADVSQEIEVLAMFEEIVSQYGRLDILVNNAGLQRDAPFWEMSLEQWQKVIDVNLTGQFLCAREAVKLFMKQGIDEHISCSAGKIVCMSSVHEVIPWAGHANYAASKGGATSCAKLCIRSITPPLDAA